MNYPGAQNIVMPWPDAAEASLSFFGQDCKLLFAPEGKEA
jgi:hypothetical protein